jgi:hypothetical protein
MLSDRDADDPPIAQDTDLFAIVIVTERPMIEAGLDTSVRFRLGLF